MIKEIVSNPWSNNESALYLYKFISKIKYLVNIVFKALLHSRILSRYSTRKIASSNIVKARLNILDIRFFELNICFIVHPNFKTYISKSFHCSLVRLLGYLRTLRIGIVPFRFGYRRDLSRHIRSETERPVRT